MEKGIRSYLSKIGKDGGKKSKRHLSSAQAKKMVEIREAKKLQHIIDMQRYGRALNKAWLLNPDEIKKVKPVKSPLMHFDSGSSFTTDGTDTPAKFVSEYKERILPKDLEDKLDSGKLEEEILRKFAKWEQRRPREIKMIHSLEDEISAYLSEGGHDE
jgi:hypothetical protein